MPAGTGKATYGAHGKDHISYSGSLELTPQFQRDIDNSRLLSPRFLFALTASLFIISATRWLSIIVFHASWFFSLLMGGLLLREAVIHIRHARNFALFSYAKKPGNLDGKLTYSRQTVLGQSTAELLGFAALFLFTYAVTGSLFLLGGSLVCAITGQEHWAMAKKAGRSEKSGMSVSA